MLDDVTSLDQIKWIFDGRKVTQRQLTENITNAIKQWKVPETILRKWGYQDNQYNFKEVFLIPYINKIFTVK